MVINNFGNKLLIKKPGIIMHDWMYNRKFIPYDEIVKIEYCFRSGMDGGYIDFHTDYNKYIRFNFAKRNNSEIKSAVNLLRKSFPELDIEEHNIETDPFYTKNIFLIIMGIFFPLFGIIFTWCAGKRPIKNRIYYTLAVLIIWGIITFTIFSIYMYQFNATMNMVNDYVNGLYY